MSSIHLASRGARIFWGEIAPTRHFAQFYDGDDVLLDTLTGFIGSGLIAGESTIVIATTSHLRALTHRLISAGIDLPRAIREDRYLTIEAEVALTSFMVDELPDERLFASFVGGLLRRASINDRRVRAFGEEAALLWGAGLKEATVRLERLWQGLCNHYSLSLFCAYPKSGFARDCSESLAEICAAHSRII